MCLTPAIPTATPSNVGYPTWPPAGCIYYVAAFLHDVLRFIPGRRELMLGAALFTSALSLWLGYLLVWVLGDFCIVCASTYLINWATLYHAYNRSMFGRKGVKQHAS